MELKFFKNNKHIFSIYCNYYKSGLYFNAGKPFSSIYNVLGEYSNQLNNVFKRWYDLAKKSFDNGSDIIFCSNSEKFLLLLEKKTISDHIYLERDSLEENPNEDNNNIKYENFILIAKKIISKKGSTLSPRVDSYTYEYEKILTYTILETIPTKDDFAILLSFLMSNVFFRFSLECIKNYGFFIKSLKTNNRLKKTLELDKNKNYIYENIIKYQDLIYDTILNSLKQFYSSSDISELLMGSFDLIENIHRKITTNIVIFYEKYYLNENDVISLETNPLELKEYLILMDKILNKKSKF